MAFPDESPLQVAQLQAVYDLETHCAQAALTFLRLYAKALATWQNSQFSAAYALLGTDECPVLNTPQSVFAATQFLAADLNNYISMFAAVNTVANTATNLGYIANMLGSDNAVI